MEEYKDLKRDLEKFNKKILDNNSIYQLQSIDNENYIQIVQVGEGFKSNYKQVHVNDFKIKDYNCIVVSLLYKKDDIMYIDDTLGYHRMCNKCTDPCISLHVYAPGKYKPTFFKKI